MAFEEIKAECLSLCADILGRVQEDLLSVETETCSRQFKTRSTVCAA